jgi:2-haloacid dehalogenase
MSRITETRTPSEKPFVFFDLGETIVDLKDTIRVLARLVAGHYPTAALWASELAKDWFLELAQSLPRKENEPFETQEQVGTRVLTRLLQARGVSSEATEAGRLLRRAWDEWQSHARLCEGVTKEWLVQIRGLSAGVVAVTDGDREDVARLMEKTALDSYFDFVITSEEVRAYKPSPRVYRAAMDRIKAPADCSIFVSDSPLDLLGAAAVGMGCAWLSRSSGGEPEVLPEGTVRLRRPSDLNPVLVRFRDSGRFAQA